MIIIIGMNVVDNLNVLYAASTVIWNKKDVRGCREENFCAKGQREVVDKVNCYARGSVWDK